ncbi:hypothetical protein AWB76_03322 [Caballeronia temeraria]|uniref:Uncharacterized protein n=1 Tax=Caballeronia temeraria TaxID=1777137 RepID=A0A158AZ31_9BURK|nr:hypothetical protein [Caballeronia temeraria]SAK63045.1 hypothetical protein AWB76_03322 [Caballeronia temeraria]
MSENTSRDAQIMRASPLHAALAGFGVDMLAGLLTALMSCTIVGEMAVYTGARRSADVVADQPAIVLRLALAPLQRLENDDPALAARLHKFVARVLAAGLVVANEQIRAAL